MLATLLQFGKQNWDENLSKSGIQVQAPVTQKAMFFSVSCLRNERRKSYYSALLAGTVSAYLRGVLGSPRTRDLMEGEFGL